MASDSTDFAPPRLRVLVANEDRDKLLPLVEAVTTIGHDVIASSVRVDEVAAVTTREQPDFALVSLGPSAQHALGMIEQIVQEAACPVIALLHGPDAEFVTEASRRGVFAVITDRDPSEWQSAIDVALSRFAEYQNLRGAFAKRAKIERAGGILMERHSVDSNAALGMLRDTARRRNRKLGDIAAAVIEGHLLLPDLSV